jgi:SAM-dependent methyltransferase
MATVATRAPAIAAGGIDWSAHWRSMVDAREASGPGNFQAGGSRWEGRAARFARLTRALDASTDPFIKVLKEALRPADVVLDVGAGAGRYSLPIASSVARLTAVEPSAGMRGNLQEEAARRGITNVTVVPSSWEDAKVEPHDVAFVANVLYFVKDAAGFVEKVDEHARRACFILHRVEERASGLLPLWEQIWGHPRPPEPGALDLYNLLFTLGIRANLQLLRRPAPVVFETGADVMREARQSLELAEDDTSHDEPIEAFLRSVITKRDGRFEFPPGPQMAIISWEKG